jgi:hypothetical protein
MANQTTRRGCLRLTTAAASVSAIEFSHALRTGNSIALIVDPGSAVTTQEPVEWAEEQFRRALTLKALLPPPLEAHLLSLSPLLRRHAGQVVDCRHQKFVPRNDHFQSLCTYSNCDTRLSSMCPGNRQCLL